jgi:hypothetical protein
MKTNDKKLKDDSVDEEGEIKKNYNRLSIKSHKRIGKPNE